MLGFSPCGSVISTPELEEKRKRKQQKLTVSFKNLFSKRNAVYRLLPYPLHNLIRRTRAPFIGMRKPRLNRVKKFPRNHTA